MTSDLIDTTEMYVRTVWELEEEGIPAIRARLTERLGLSAPSVSETVARLQQDGLLRLNADRTLELTHDGRELAVSVMRKHRLAERLLVDVIGLEWEHVHVEACRWEHVISDDVEHKLVELLERPERDPHGNTIPDRERGDHPAHGLPSLTQAAKDGAGAVRIDRMSEHLQADIDAMRFLAGHQLRPGAVVSIERTEGDAVVVDDGSGPVRVDDVLASLVYVTVSSTAPAATHA